MNRFLVGLAFVVTVLVLKLRSWHRPMTRTEWIIFASAFVATLVGFILIER